MFIYNHYLLFQGNPLYVLIGSIAAFVCIIGLAAGVQGYLLTDLSILERLALLASPVLMISPSMTYKVTAIALIVIVLFFQKTKIRKELKIKPNVA